MKKAGSLYILFPVLFLVLLNSPAFAQEIQTGNQSAETKITNNVNGGSVTTHIETTVNGQTTTVDSNEPGKIEVENNNGNVKINKTAQEEPSVSPSNTASATPKILPKKTELKNIISSFFEEISRFFKRIFDNL